MRPKQISANVKIPYHLPFYEGDCNQDTHYFHPLCHQCELKSMYGTWDIQDDPPKDQRCKKCLVILEDKSQIKGVKL